MKARTYRAPILVVALALGHTAVIGSVAQAAPSNGTSIRAVQNSSGATAIIIVTNKKYAKGSIVVTSTSLQGRSGPKTSILGSVSVGKNGTAVVTSAIPLPEKLTLSVFSGSNHLMTVVDIPFPKVTTLPKSSKAAASSKSTTKKILQAAANIWRKTFNASNKQGIVSASVALRDAMNSAMAALNTYARAGGDTKNQVAVALLGAIQARPPVIADITTAANAVREATTRLPAPLDPVALRDAVDSAVVTLNAYARTGGDIKNQVAVALVGAIQARPPVIADITTAANAVREATTRLPAPLDPVVISAARDSALKDLNAYLAAGGSNQDELVVSLLGAMKVFPSVLADITRAANAIRVATKQLPTNVNPGQAPTQEVSQGVATNQSPPSVDPGQAAMEEELRGLVVRAEALLDSYFASGGDMDDVALALLGALNADPQNSSNIVTAMNALSFATNQLPPLVDPGQAAIEEVLRGLVAEAVALLNSYSASGGSTEDDVALALLGAVNADPQNASNIVAAMNALSLATALLPIPDDVATNELPIPDDVATNELPTP